MCRLANKELGLEGVGAAVRSNRVTLGAIVTPPSQRRPWKLARERMTLDRLSNGRLIVAVGLGAVDDQGFGNVGEATDRNTRAAMLAESLHILSGLWSGEPFSFHGAHYWVDEMTFRLFMAALFGTAVACVALAVASLFGWGESGAVYLLGGSLLYLVGVVLVTIAFNVPRNDALAAVDPDSADGATRWTRYVPGWTAWNTVRTAAAVGAAALLTIALVAG